MSFSSSGSPPWSGSTMRAPRRVLFCEGSASSSSSRISSSELAMTLLYPSRMLITQALLPASCGMPGLDVAHLLGAKRAHRALMRAGDRLEHVGHMIARVDPIEHPPDEPGADPVEDGNAFGPGVPRLATEFVDEGPVLG